MIDAKDLETFVSSNFSSDRDSHSLTQPKADESVTEALQATEGKRPVPRVFKPASAVKRKDLVGRRFAEVFCGVGHLAKAFAREGIESEGWDILDGPGADFLDPQVVENFKRRILDHKYLAIHFGFPCISWSRARRFDNKGPPPLRDDTDHLMFGIIS